MIIKLNPAIMGFLQVNTRTAVKINEGIECRKNPRTCSPNVRSEEKASSENKDRKAI